MFKLEIALLKLDQILCGEIKLYIFSVRINPSGKECPIPLQMAASNLLYQITAFLKDTNLDMLNRKESSASTELIGRFVSRLVDWL